MYERARAGTPARDMRVSSRPPSGPRVQVPSRISYGRRARAPHAPQRWSGPPGRAAARHSPIRLHDRYSRIARRSARVDPAIGDVLLNMCRRCIGTSSSPRSCSSPGSSRSRRSIAHRRPTSNARRRRSGINSPQTLSLAPPPHPSIGGGRRPESRSGIESVGGQRGGQKCGDAARSSSQQDGTDARLHLVPEVRVRRAPFRYAPRSCNALVHTTSPSSTHTTLVLRPAEKVCHGLAFSRHRLFERDAIVGSRCMVIRRCSACSARSRCSSRRDRLGDDRARLRVSACHCCSGRRSRSFSRCRRWA